MAFPAVASLTPTAFSTDATQHLVAMPATVDVGDLLIVGFANDGGATVATPGSWNLLSSNAQSTNVRLSLFYKIASGSEDGTTVDFVTSAVEKGAAHCYRITGWHGTTPPEVGTAASGSSASPNAPTLTSSWGADDTLWLAWYGNDGAGTASAYPTSYTNGTNTVATAPNAAGIASARRDLNAASDDPAVFTMTTAPWVAQTVAIRPVAVIVPVTGVLGGVQGDQTGAFTGTVIPPAVTGVLGAVQEDQTAALAGTVTLPAVTGTLTAVQDDNTAQLAGTVTIPAVVGVLDAVQANQTSGLVGVVTNPVTATPVSATSTVTSGSASSVVTAGSVSSVVGSWSVESQV